MELSEKEWTILHTLALKGGQPLLDVPWMILDRLLKAKLITEVWRWRHTGEAGGQYFLTPQGAELCRAQFKDLPEDIKAVSPTNDSTNRI